MNGGRKKKKDSEHLGRKEVGLRREEILYARQAEAIQMIDRAAQGQWGQVPTEDELQALLSNHQILQPCAILPEKHNGVY